MLDFIYLILSVCRHAVATVCITRKGTSSASSEVKDLRASRTMRWR